LIDARASRGQPTVLVTIHSFNPVYNGKTRDVELGILHDADARFADCLLLAASSLTKLKTERNQPYGPQDGVTHTLVRHAIHRGLLNAMIEIRNDLIREAADQANMADLVANMLQHAFEAARMGAVEPLEPGGADASGD
jgi:predicted N-formylglutamate amidohydrolase